NLDQDQQQEESESPSDEASEVGDIVDNDVITDNWAQNLNEYYSHDEDSILIPLNQCRTLIKMLKNSSILSLYLLLNLQN
ncbi:unnamed protein product, partial [Didymodactylos carnosus]